MVCFVNISVLQCKIKNSYLITDSPYATTSISNSHLQQIIRVLFLLYSFDAILLWGPIVFSPMLKQSSTTAIRIAYVCLQNDCTENVRNSTNIQRGTFIQGFLPIREIREIFENFFQSGKSGENMGVSVKIREKIFKSGNFFSKPFLGLENLFSGAVRKLHLMTQGKNQGI